jgi:co-chaperonin GroES (HSP10)
VVIIHADMEMTVTKEGVLLSVPQKQKAWHAMVVVVGRM